MVNRPLQEQIRRYRVPGEDRSVFVDPPWESIPEILAFNQTLLAETARYDCQGKTLGQLARQARAALLVEAWKWTASYQDLPCSPETGSASGLHSPGTDPPERTPTRIFLAGHQPQLFHPGVWLKNFALEGLARTWQAVAINLLVDNDAPRSVQVSVPGGSVERPRWTEIPLDAPAPGVAYEDRPVVDWELFVSFGCRGLKELGGLVRDPMLREFWPAAIGRARETNRLGAALAQARHLWECRWGLRTREVPLSRLCQEEGFMWFVAYLLAQLPRFHQHYNQILAEYRRTHRIRNPAQPVPNLRAEDGWWEAPFWIWTNQDPRRRPVYVRSVGSETTLSDRAGLCIRLPISAEGDLTRAVDRLQELNEQGVRIRPRALITTLWARLALGDLFIHGIGGARYDQITDGIIRRFFGLEPPVFLVLSGTLYLPIRRPQVSRKELLEVQRRLRQLTWQPERFLSSPQFWTSQPPDEKEKAPAGAGVSADSPSAPLPEATKPPAQTSRPPQGDRLQIEALLAEKHRWIHTPVTPENARTRFLAIRRLNEAMQSYVADLRKKLLAEKAHLEAQLQAEKILSWRDYPFCFYPEQTLREFFAAVLPTASRSSAGKD